jgi:hypothetical protein
MVYLLTKQLKFPGVGLSRHQPHDVEGLNSQG